jgi:hypothetical protein
MVAAKSQLCVGSLVERITASGPDLPYAESKMPDIPNNLALLISIMITVASILFRNEIETMIAKWKEAAAIKLKTTAFADYKELYTMRNDCVYYSIKLAKMHSYGRFC